MGFDVTTFDDFAKKHEQRKQDEERLLKDTKPEWEILKGEISRFALDGKGIGSHQFRWVSDPSERTAFFILNDVAAFVSDSGEHNGVPQHCRVRFDRRPPDLNKLWVDDKSPVSSKTWSLKPMIEEGDFRWSVPERGWTFTSGQLAEEIAKQLAQHHIAYQKAYRRTS
jgi:hypothetical protein